MRKFFAIILVSFMVGGLFAGCSVEEEKPEAKEPEVVEKEAVEEEPVAEEPEEEEVEEEPEVEEEEESPDYAAFLIDHIARVFQAAELEGQEEREALQELAEEYLARDDVPGELERVHELYSEAMELYAQGDEDDAFAAFFFIAEAAEELEKHVDFDEYE